MRSERVFALDLMPSLCLKSSISVMSVIRPAGGWIEMLCFLKILLRNMVFFRWMFGMFSVLLQVLGFESTSNKSLRIS
jgi:hypothetical protein